MAIQQKGGSALPSSASYVSAALQQNHSGNSHQSSSNNHKSVVHTQPPAMQHSQSVMVRKEDLKEGSKPLFSSSHQAWAAAAGQKSPPRIRRSNSVSSPSKMGQEISVDAEKAYQDKVAVEISTMIGWLEGVMMCFRDHAKYLESAVKYYHSQNSNNPLHTSAFSPYKTSAAVKSPLASDAESDNPHAWVAFLLGVSKEARIRADRGILTNQKEVQFAERIFQIAQLFSQNISKADTARSKAKKEKKDAKSAMPGDENYSNSLAVGDEKGVPKGVASSNGASFYRQARNPVKDFFEIREGWGNELTFLMVSLSHFLQFPSANNTAKIKAKLRPSDPLHACFDMFLGSAAAKTQLGPGYKIKGLRAEFEELLTALPTGNLSVQEALTRIANAAKEVPSSSQDPFDLKLLAFAQCMQTVFDNQRLQTNPASTVVTSDITKVSNKELYMKTMRIYIHATKYGGDEAFIAGSGDPKSPLHQSAVEMNNACIALSQANKSQSGRIGHHRSASMIGFGSTQPTK